jgi:hypothetical protein
LYHYNMYTQFRVSFLFFRAMSIRERTGSFCDRLLFSSRDSLHYQSCFF